jgi:phage FluMu gp28-like protein
MQLSKRIHVVPHEDGWATKREGASRAGSVHGTQAEAQAAARQTAIREGGEVIIHRPDGRIRDSDSYGNDPFPPKG